MGGATDGIVGKETYSLLSNLLAPAKPASKSYEELVAALKAHLKPKSTSLVMDGKNISNGVDRSFVVYSV